jgi:hypothetical protein
LEKKKLYFAMISLPEKRFSRIATLLFILALFASHVAGQVKWFKDNFLPSDPGPQWKSSTGEWKVDSGVLSIQTKDYDRLFLDFLAKPSIRTFQKFGDRSR